MTTAAPLAITVRPEQAGDAETVHAVLADAFGGRAEDDLVERLCTGDDLVLALVAEVDDRGVVGHIGFPRLVVDAPSSLKVWAIEDRLVLVAASLLAVAHRLVTVEDRLVLIAHGLLAVTHRLLAIALGLRLITLVLIAFEVEPSRHAALGRLLCPEGEQSKQCSGHNQSHRELPSFVIYDGTRMRLVHSIY